MFDGGFCVDLTARPFFFTQALYLLAMLFSGSLPSDKAGVQWDSLASISAIYSISAARHASTDAVYVATLCLRGISQTFCFEGCPVHPVVCNAGADSAFTKTSHRGGMAA